MTCFTADEPNGGLAVHECSVDQTVEPARTPVSKSIGKNCEGVPGVCIVAHGLWLFL